MVPPSVCGEPHGSWDLCCDKCLFPSQESPFEPECVSAWSILMFGFYKIFVNTFFLFSWHFFYFCLYLPCRGWSWIYFVLFIYFLSFIVIVSFYRVAAWVKEPVCIFPVEKIALWKLLAACHLENNDGESCHEGNNDDFDDHDPERLSLWEWW